MPQIKHNTYIKVTPDKVYETLVSGEGWDAWFTEGTTVKWNESGTGEIRLRWRNVGIDNIDTEDGGPILKAEKPRSFVFQWSPGENPTTVNFTIESYRDGTNVSVNETGYSTSEKDIKACLDCAAGWGEALTLLKVYLEHGITFELPTT